MNIPQKNEIKTVNCRLSHSRKSSAAAAAAAAHFNDVLLPSSYVISCVWRSFTLCHHQKKATQDVVLNKTKKKIERKKQKIQERKSICAWSLLLVVISLFSVRLFESKLKLISFETLYLMWERWLQLLTLIIVVVVAWISCAIGKCHCNFYSHCCHISSPFPSAWLFLFCFVWCILQATDNRAIRFIVNSISFLYVQRSFFNFLWSSLEHENLFRQKNFLAKWERRNGGKLTDLARSFCMWNDTESKKERAIPELNSTGNVHICFN